MIRLEKTLNASSRNPISKRKEESASKLKMSMRPQPRPNADAGVDPFWNAGVAEVEALAVRYTPATRNPAHCCRVYLGTNER